MKKGMSVKYGILLSVIGAVIMIAGALNGEASDIYEKAVRICLECIGIG